MGPDGGHRTAWPAFIYSAWLGTVWAKITDSERPANSAWSHNSLLCKLFSKYLRESYSYTAVHTEQRLSLGVSESARCPAWACSE